MKIYIKNKYDTIVIALLVIALIVYFVCLAFFNYELSIFEESSKKEYVVLPTRWIFFSLNITIKIISIFFLMTIIRGVVCGKYIRFLPYYLLLFMMLLIPQFILSFSFILTFQTSFDVIDGALRIIPYF
mgnify:CR=1 FL=1